MKIIFNTNQTYLHGGVEKVMATKANYFATLPDVEVYILTTEQQNNPPCYFLDKRIKTIDLGINYNRSKFYFSKENLRKAVKHFKSQKKIFKELDPDIIISPNFNFDLYWLPFIHRKSKKIKEIHGSRYNWKSSLKNRVNAFFEKRYDALVILNKDEAAYFSSNNVIIIPNPVDLPNLRAELTKKQVVAAGRISPVKGFSDLIESWGIVSKDFPDWQLHIYGQDYQGTQRILEQQIKNLTLENIIFKGSVEDLPKIMTQYSIYAMSSINECFPMVLLEALSVGLPVVSYDCPNGPRNIITLGDDGFLAKYRNPENLAENLKRLMGNEELRKKMGNHAKENICRFTTKEVMKQWQSLLNLPNV